ncbi:MAG: hypothetical protein ACI4J2_06600, partial [Ruminococcus sp.]
ILQMHANHREDISTVYSGDIEDETDETEEETDDIEDEIVDTEDETADIEDETDDTEDETAETGEETDDTGDETDETGDETVDTEDETAETGEETDDIEEETDDIEEETGEDIEIDDEIPGEFSGYIEDSSFDLEAREEYPEMFENGEYLEQGINEYGFEGTCGPTSQANALNELLGTNEFTENKVLTVAIDNDLCNCDSLDPGDNGGTSTDQFMELYDKMNEITGDKLNVERFDYENALSAEEMAEKIESGSVLNIAVDSDTLWDMNDHIPGEMGQDKYTDHWITVTGVDRNADGSIAGFKIVDSGGGETYADLEKYERMCFGEEGREMIDPTCIAVSKKPELDNSPAVPGGDIPNDVPTTPSGGKNPRVINGFSGGSSNRYVMNSEATIAEMRENLPESSRPYFDEALSSGTNHHVRLVGENSDFYVAGNSSGNYLAKDIPGTSPEEIRENLQLPAGNSAEYVTRVRPTHAMPVIESTVAPQPEWAQEAGYTARPGIQQFTNVHAGGTAFDGNHLTREEVVLDFRKPKK